MVRKAVAHGGSLRRTAESAREPVRQLVDFGLPENDHVGMRQHSGVFVSGGIRSSSFYPSEICTTVARDNILQSAGLEEIKPYQRVDLCPEKDSAFRIPFDTR
ncbi:hypothetical protein [Paracoccus versutus]|uniref:hypothetical protein n=1 Tax=Paracoccus versutus TaxID=34007 RepID=UPI0011C04DC9|nr:hypothetical protein [Paracoccus versutus]